MVTAPTINRSIQLTSIVRSMFIFVHNCVRHRSLHINLMYRSVGACLTMLLEINCLHQDFVHCRLLLKATKVFFSGFSPLPCLVRLDIQGDKLPSV